MQNEFKHLLSKLTVTECKDHGATVKLIDYEHTDYIEDVLAEHFDIEYEYKISNEEENEYILCFGEKASTEQVEKATKLINSYHSKNGKLYETI